MCYPKQQVNANLWCETRNYFSSILHVVLCHIALLKKARGITLRQFTVVWEPFHFLANEIFIALLGVILKPCRASFAVPP